MPWLKVLGRNSLGARTILAEQKYKVSTLYLERRLQSGELGDGFPPPP